MSRPCVLRVVNWEKFQNYKDRTPPWIKFHAELLEDARLSTLPDNTKGHLFSIWLFASRKANAIPADPAFVAKRINAKSKVDLNLLIKTSFLEWACGCSFHASNPQASCDTACRARLQSDTQSREEERREETEEKPETDDGREVVVRIFDHWRKTMPGREDAHLTKLREQRVRDRLLEGYNESQIIRAIDGNRGSEWHQGKNDRKKPYNDLELICRSGDKLESFLSKPPVVVESGLGVPLKGPWEKDGTEG